MSRITDTLMEQRAEATKSIPRLQQEVANAERALNEAVAKLNDAQALVKDCDDAVAALGEIAAVKEAAASEEQ